MPRLNLFRVLFSALLLPIILVGCAGEPFSNAFAPEVGDTRQVTIVKTEEVGMQIMGMDMDTTSSTELKATLEVTEVLAEDGAVMLDVTIDTLSSDQVMPKIPGMDLGSAMAGMQKDVREALASAAGEQFSLKVSSAGEIILARGLNDLADRVQRKAGITGGSAQLVNSRIDAELGQDAVEELLGTVFRAYHPGPAKAGDTWSTNRTVRGGMPVTIDTEFTLGATDGPTYEVTAASTRTVSGAPENMPGMPDGMNVQITMDLSGTGTATMVVDKASSWVTDARSEYTLQGKMNMGGMPGQNNMGMDMTVSGVATVAVVPVAARPEAPSADALETAGETAK